MQKHKLLIFLIVGLFLIQYQSGISQSFSFYGGVKPIRPYPTNFSVKADLIHKNKWVFAINYSFVKYNDNFHIYTDSIYGLNLENEYEKTIYDLPELERGIPIQFDKVDPRPFEIYHSFSLYAGYNILDNSYFTLKAYTGICVGINKIIIVDITQEEVDIIFNADDEPREIFYRDYQTFSEINFGASARINAEYKLFENMYVGLDIQTYLGFYFGDVLIGIGGTYLF